MDVRFSFLTTDDLLGFLQSEFTDLILLHHKDDRWCLHTSSGPGFQGATPREATLKALAFHLDRRASARLN